MIIIKFIKSLYVTKQFFTAAFVLIALFVTGHFLPLLFPVSKLLLTAFIVLTAIDLLLLYGNPDTKITAQRLVSERLSNGDNNKITVIVSSLYPFALKIILIDEIPFQFQERNFKIKEKLPARQQITVMYQLRPVKRGVYHFGNINIYAKTSIGMIQKRIKIDAQCQIPVYPSYIQLHKYELMAISNKLVDTGIKKVRRISNNKEFEEIRDYVTGDDYRTINWKTTARKSHLMVNQFQDEKSQQVYNLIDMGRTMKMPFNGMSLLDYAINTSLVLSNIAIKKHDKAGLITFSKNIHTIIQPSRKTSQMQLIMDALYRQTTNFYETDTEILYATIRHKIKQRSLLLFYTNFEGLNSMQRQLKHFRNIAKNHLLLIIFFENTEVTQLTHTNAKDTEDIYIKTIAEKFLFEKKLILKELNKYGIYAIITDPKQLTINTINKYLEFKALGYI